MDSLVERRTIVVTRTIAGAGLARSIGALTVTDDHRRPIRVEMLAAKWTTIALPLQPWVEIAGCAVKLQARASFMLGIEHYLKRRRPPPVHPRC